MSIQEQKDTLDKYGRMFESWVNTEDGRQIVGEHRDHQKFFKDRLSATNLSKMTEQEFIELFLRAQMNLLTNDKYFQFLRTANQHLGLKTEEWESGRKFFQSLDNKQIERVAEAIVGAIPMLENRNLFQPYYILYSIFKI